MFKLKSLSLLLYLEVNLLNESIISRKLVVWKFSFCGKFLIKRLNFIFFIPYLLPWGLQLKAEHFSQQFQSVSAYSCQSLRCRAKKSRYWLIIFNWMIQFKEPTKAMSFFPARFSAGALTLFRVAPSKKNISKSILEWITQNMNLTLDGLEQVRAGLCFVRHFELGRTLFLILGYGGQYWSECLTICDQIMQLLSTSACLSHHNRIIFLLLHPLSRILDPGGAGDTLRWVRIKVNDSPSRQAD